MHASATARCKNRREREIESDADQCIAMVMTEPRGISSPKCETLWRTRPKCHHTRSLFSLLFGSLDASLVQHQSLFVGFRRFLASTPFQVFVIALTLLRPLSSAYNGSRFCFVLSHWEIGDINLNFNFNFTICPLSQTGLVSFTLHLDCPYLCLAIAHYMDSGWLNG